jgi:formylglycine-generating enzyme required for sulfatase activity
MKKSIFLFIIVLVSFGCEEWILPEDASSALAAEEARQVIIAKQAEQDKQANIFWEVLKYNKGYFLDGGTFTMGSSAGDPDETPHNVTVSRFWIAASEVTQETWFWVMGSYPPNMVNKNCSTCPIESVTWAEIQVFLQKLNEKIGDNLRLPTEAEWEFAARGGTYEPYSGSYYADEVAWFNGNSPTKSQPVRQKKANGYGLYDMSGNVWEFCSDWYGETYYKSSPINNPKGPSSGTLKVARGGAWVHPAEACRVAYRGHTGDNERQFYMGFRLAF